jgi:hypothetical protein
MAIAEQLNTRKNLYYSFALKGITVENWTCIQLYTAV